MDTQDLIQAHFQKRDGCQRSFLFIFASYINPNLGHFLRYFHQACTQCVYQLKQGQEQFWPHLKNKMATMGFSISSIVILLDNKLLQITCKQPNPNLTLIHKIKLPHAPLVPNQVKLILLYPEKQGYYGSWTVIIRACVRRDFFVIDLQAALSFAYIKYGVCLHKP